MIVSAVILPGLPVILLARGAGCLLNAAIKRGRLTLPACGVLALIWRPWFIMLLCAYGQIRRT